MKKGSTFIEMVIKYNIQAPPLSTHNQYGCHQAISIVASEFPSPLAIVGTHFTFSG